MAKQPHWEYFYYGPKHPPPPARFPWLRDAILATVVGALLGVIIGLRMALGYWTMANLYFVPAVVIHALIVGLGQLFKATRRSRTEFVRMVLLEIAAAIVAASATLLLVS